MKEVYRAMRCRSCRRRRNAEYTPIPAAVSVATAVDTHSDGGSLIDIADTDGLFKLEWIVAAVNMVSIGGLLVATTYIVSQYMSDYAQFVEQRMAYLQVLAAMELLWFGGQFLLWKVGCYGTIFYLLLLIPSLVHTFLAVLFACGEFHLVGPHDDDTTLDPSDWSVLGVLALLAKLFRFRLPQQQPQST